MLNRTLDVNGVKISIPVSLDKPTNYFFVIGSNVYCKIDNDQIIQIDVLPENL